MQEETMSAATVTPQTETTDTCVPWGDTAEDLAVMPEASDTAEAPTGTEETSDFGTQAEETTGGVRVRFNHTERQLDPQETVAYAQKGLKWDAFQADYDRLRFLAEGAGQTVSELIDGWMERDRETELQEVLEKCGDRETAQQLVDLRRRQRQARFETSQETQTRQEQEQRQQCSERLATGYQELKKAVPDVPAFDQLPAPVIRAAVTKEISLYDAYLRFCYEQQRRQEEAAVHQQRAADASTGSLSENKEISGGESQAFLSAFERVFS